MGVEGVSGRSRAGCVWDGVRVKPGKGERAGERQSGEGERAGERQPGVGERAGERQSGGRDSLELSSGSSHTYFYNEYQDYGCQGYGNPGEWANSLRYRYSHTAVHTSTEFFEAAGEILRKAREGNKDSLGGISTHPLGVGAGDCIGAEDYDDADVDAAYGLAYRKLSEEIEKRHEGGEQWFDIDGTLLTREREMERLNAAYEAAASFQASSRRVISGLRQLSQRMQEEARRESGGMD